MNINDLFTTSGAEISSTMDSMDVSVNYDNPELMSSEFFDSVLSLENNMDDGFLSSFEDDINLSSDTSSHIDEVLSPQSFYSESDKNSSCAENTDDSALINNIDSIDEPLLMSLLNSVPDFQTVNPIAPQPIDKQPTKILIQNPNNKKFIAKPMIATTQLKKPSPKIKPQIIKVQPFVNDGRQVLLPLSLKSIKILNTPVNVAALTKTFKTTKPKAEVSSEDETNIVSSTNQYPPLKLTQEERKLLAKEGIQLPTHHPLTKNEERELKRIRRKIRNKISAQDSRKRKKEYVDGLEERVKRGSEENKNLLQRVRALQRQNRTLLAHVNKLQAMIRNSTTSKATPSTCLMVVLLSALLVSLPNMKLFENREISTEQEQGAIRRSLLSSPQQTEEDILNMEEFLVFKDDDDSKTKFSEDVADIENSTDKEFSKMLKDIENNYGNFLSEKDNNKNVNIFSNVMNSVKKFLYCKPELLGATDYGGYGSKGAFLEPDIDDEDVSVDEDPPLKRMKLSDRIKEPPENIVISTVNQNYVGFNTKDK